MYNLKIKFKTYLVVGFLFISSTCLNAQNQHVADSLAIEFKQNKKSGKDRLDLLYELAFNESENLRLSLKYSRLLIEESKELGNEKYIAIGFNQSGHALRLLGDLDDALSAYFNGAEFAIKSNHLTNEGTAYASIADVYSEMGNSDNAELYYDKAIQILRQTNGKVSLATALLNAGDEAFNNQQYQKALAYFEESGILFEKEDYLIGTAYNLGNSGMVYAELKEYALAEENIYQAISILENLGDYSAIAEYMTYLADIYVDKQDMESAFKYAHSSLDIALKNNLQKQISESNLKLSELHKINGNADSTWTYFQTHMAYRDSLRNLERIEKMAYQNIEFSNSEVARKQLEVDVAEARSLTQMIISGFSILLLFTLFYNYRSIRNEKRKSEKLLLNILPLETADELKKSGKVKAKKYDSISVLFTDFKGFTSYSEKLSPEELVKTIGFYFSKFDTIIEKYNLEKIKTIGDGYMCAGGLYQNTEDHAKKIVAAGLEIAAFVELTKNNMADGDKNFDIRIGINTGPVVAGVVGTKKFAYDIWGDTVNVASRMESNGKIGRVNISEQTYAFVKDDYDVEYRGEIAVKNRGHLKMYLIKAS